MIRKAAFGKKVARHRAIKNPIHHLAHGYRHKRAARTARRAMIKHHRSARAAKSVGKFKLFKAHLDGFRKAYKLALAHRAWGKFHARMFNRLTRRN